MMATTSRILLWTPRLLTLAFIAFVSLFALDVFDEHLSFGQLAIALSMHLIPSAILLIALIIAWRWPAIGGALFIAAGLYYSLGMARHHLLWIVVIAGPAFVIGALFLLSARRSR